MCRGAGSICKRLETIAHVDIIIGTVPAGAQQADFPAGLFVRHPLVLDAAYRPRWTPLLRQARAHGCATVSGPWAPSHWLPCLAQTHEPRLVADADAGWA